MKVNVRNLLIVSVMSIATSVALTVIWLTMLFSVWLFFALAVIDAIAVGLFCEKRWPILIDSK